MGFQSISARTGVQGRSANQEPVASSDGKLKGVDVMGEVLRVLQRKRPSASLKPRIYVTGRPAVMHCTARPESNNAFTTDTQHVTTASL